MSTDEVSWLGTSLGASVRDGFLEDSMLKNILTVRSLVNLFRSLKSVKGLGLVVGAKVKPLLNKDTSWGLDYGRGH